LDGRRHEILTAGPAWIDGGAIGRATA